MKTILFIIACFAFVAMFCPKTAVARVGCSAAPAATCQAEAPVQYAAPAVGVCIAQRVDGQPLRNAGRVVIAAPRRTVAWFQERKPVRRAVAAPFKWLKGCN